MQTTNNIVLITGGSAGIGLEIARHFVRLGNRVIITGRDRDRLDRAVSELGGGVTGIAADVTSAEDQDRLAARILKDFPGLNILVNNAGVASVFRLGAGADAVQKAASEMQTNYFAVLGLTEKLLPVLERQHEVAIVNVSSIVTFAPAINIPTYSASKAAVHAYTRVLRLTLAKSTNVKVFELMPPLVNTDLSKEIGGSGGIPPAQVAEALLDALARDEYEIHVGATGDIYRLYLTSPEKALEALNAGR